MRGFIIVRREYELPQPVDAVRAASRFARRLNGRQQERHQDADDGNDDKELDQCKTV